MARVGLFLVALGLLVSRWNGLVAGEEFETLYEVLKAANDLPAVSPEQPENADPWNKLESQYYESFNGQANCAMTGRRPAKVRLTVAVRRHFQATR